MVRSETCQPNGRCREHGGGEAASTIICPTHLQPSRCQLRLAHLKHWSFTERNQRNRNFCLLEGKVFLQMFFGSLPLKS